MDDLWSTKSADGDAGLSCDLDWKGWGVGGWRVGNVFERGGAGFIANRRGRHLVRSVVAAVGDAAGE